MRERMRRLPARAAERAIRNLQRNAAGFWQLGIFLAFYSLYFAIVFRSIDVAFERSVGQALRAHVNAVSACSPSLPPKR